MIKKHLLKTILTATVVATLLTATACGSKQISDNNTTVQQTTEAVKVVSNVDVKSEADKKESEKKEEADKEQTTEAGETTEETKEEAADNAEQNDEAVAGEVNETFEELKEAINEPQNTAEAPVQEEQAAPAEQPAEAPAENNNAGAVDTAPEEQPAAPAEPVVTPQEPAKNYIPYKNYIFGDEYVMDCTWDDMIPTSNKYIYHYIDSVGRNNYCTFNQSLDTIVAFSTSYYENPDDIIPYLVDTPELPYLKY